MSGRSIVEYFAEHEKYRCGYCGSKDTNYSHGMWAHALTVEDYQDLIDRGWRRSGKYCYKPTMNMTCCPQHTIRCAALEFTLNKSHKKVIKNFNQYINHGKKPKQSDNPVEAVMDGEMHPVNDSPPQLKVMSPFEVPQMDEGASAEVVMRNDACDARTSQEATNCDASRPQSVKQKAPPKPGSGPDPNKPPCQKAKNRRKEKWRLKQEMKSHSEPGTSGQAKGDSAGKSLEDFLQDISDNPVNKLEMRLVRSNPRSKDFEKYFDESYAIYKKYQMAVHNDPPDKPSVKQLIRSHPPSEEFRDTQEESYQVYKKYQMKIHKDKPDECDEANYLRFLVHSPLSPKHRQGGFSQGYGSFHQHYVINGRIVAVGVIDILPKCVSSVYLYYDPDAFFLSIGTYSALQELAFTRYLHTVEPTIKYYYMGFYIHSCPKMRYKGQYHPSFLLCPEAYSWQPIEACHPKLDKTKYCRLDETDKEDIDGNVDIDHVLVLHQHTALPYAIYSRFRPDADDEDEVKEYASLVGQTCASRMLLYRV